MGKLLFLFSFFIFIFVLYFYSYSYSFVYSFIVLYIYIYRKYEYEDEVPVPLTGIDGQSRTSDEAVERPLQVRYDEKMAKYGQVAERNNLRFIPPAIFFHTHTHTGQIHEVHLTVSCRQSAA